MPTRIGGVTQPRLAAIGAGRADTMLRVLEVKAAAAETAGSDSSAEESVATTVPDTTAFYENCAGCHGKVLDGTSFGPPLNGPEFTKKWASSSP